eukprot:2509739-Rhodomonas_salina.1
MQTETEPEPSARERERAHTREGGRGGLWRVCVFAGGGGEAVESGPGVCGGGAGLRARGLHQNRR